jgi:iron complex transport system substrate-binding protein
MTMQVSRPKVLSLLCLSAAVLLAGCGGNARASKPPRATHGAFPITISTPTGRVTIKTRPTRIVSLSSTLTEMLYAVGAGHQVKAVDKYSDYPPSAPRTKLDELSLDVESLIAMNPDLVMVSYPDAQLSAQLARLSIPLLDLPAATNIPEVYAEITDVGEATGHDRQAAAENRHIQRAIATIVASVPRPKKPLTYYWELDPTYYSVTSNTFVGHLLSLLGLKSIADAGSGGVNAAGGYPQLSAEFILRENPDFIFLADTICCHQTAATVAHRPGWSVLRAVRLHHIVLLNDSIASRWGPRIVLLLRAVADALKRAGG